MEDGFVCLDCVDGAKGNSVINMTRRGIVGVCHSGLQDCGMGVTKRNVMVKETMHVWFHGRERAEVGWRVSSGLSEGEDITGRRHDGCLRGLSGVGESVIERLVCVVTCDRLRESECRSTGLFLCTSLLPSMTFSDFY